MATSDAEICNLALQKLGAARIVSLTEDSPSARECNACYARVRNRELRAHPWSFAVARVSLAADATAPDFGYVTQFTLPAGFLRLIEPDPMGNYNTLDWVIEGKKILTHDSAPLEIRYIQEITDPNTFDELFNEVLACSLALQMCEKVTQSNTKKAGIADERKAAIAEARRTNAIEKISADPPEDTWITARR